MGRFDWAPAAFRRLNGVICIYKPTGISSRQALYTVKKNLLRDLNALPCYKHEIKLPVYQQNIRATDTVRTPASTNVPTEMEDLSEHRLVLGARYIEEDLRMNFMHAINSRSSGVLALFIGRKGREYLHMMALARYLRVYHVKGRFGYATDNFFTDGKFIERTTYHHINKGKLDKVCSAAQSNHQRLMFQYAGVDPQSQEAYELASGGMVRPQNTDTPPMLYGVKCIDLNLPDFTLEIHAINETDTYLSSLLHDIGLKLKSNAVCTHIHRLRYGHLNVDHTLLRKDWNLESIINNIKHTERLLTPQKLLTNMAVATDAELSETPETLGISDGEEKDAESLIKTIVGKSPGS